MDNIDEQRKEYIRDNFFENGEPETNIHFDPVDFFAFITHVH